MASAQPFQYASFNARPHLPPDWQREMTAFAIKHAQHTIITPTHSTSRERNRNLKLHTWVVPGGLVQRDLSWLHKFYVGTGLEGMQAFYTSERLFPCKNPRYNLLLQLQKNNNALPEGANPENELMRYECHIDEFPTLLLPAQTLRKGSGGGLVIAKNPDAVGPEQIDRNSKIIYQKAGEALCLDLRTHPHYVRPLLKGEWRITAAGLYCTGRTKGSCPESKRSLDLDQHLSHVLADGALTAST